MKWVALVIVLGIALYTFLTLHFRKPGRPFQPYQDTQDRATVARLVNAGWQKLTAEVERPAEAPRAADLPSPPARPAVAASALPAERNYALLEKPRLAARIGAVSAPGELSAGAALRLFFTCTGSDLKQQLGDVLVLRKGSELFLIPRFEHTPGSLLARSTEFAAWIILPAGAIKPGHYHTTLVGAAGSKNWDMDVR